MSGFIAGLAAVLAAGAPEGPPSALTTLDEMRVLEQAFEASAQEVAPSVVSVVVDREAGGSRSARQVRMTPQGRVEIRRGRAWEPAGGAGTGLVISADGLILTSTFYTTGRVKRVLVVMPDGTPYEAKVLGSDEGRGVVLLRIEPDRALPVPRLADPEGARVGQWVVALGRTYGEVAPSVNTGIVSATGRIGGRAVQTDAAISPINYGGPLVDLQGCVVGLCVPLSPNPGLPGTAFYDSGIGFAVPVADLLPVLPRLAAGEVLRPGFLGIQFDTERLGAGAAVRQVIPETAAARAGLQPGDVVTELDGKPVANGFDLMNRVGRKYAGEEMSVTLTRGGEVRRLTVTLGERPAPATRPLPRTRPASRPTP